MARKNLLSPNLGQTPVDNLVNGNILSIVPFDVLVVPDGEEFKRGTPLELDDAAANTYKRAADAIHAILPDDLGIIDENTPSVAWGMGQYNENVMDWSAVTDRAAVIVEARARHIYITPSEKAPYVAP